MAKQGGVAARVEQLVRPVVEEMGLRLWDVCYEKEGPEWYLRVLIQRAEDDDEPMDTDTCALVSHAIDPLLDEADPIQDSYYLEVGSPGLGRKLNRPEHFAACVGQKVSAHLYRAIDGSKDIAGILLAADGEKATLQTETGEVELPFKDASYFKLCDDENLFG